MKKLFQLALILVLLTGCNVGKEDIAITSNSSSYNREAKIHRPDWVFVKYRDGTVDIADPLFEYLDAAKSSLIRGAWYDEGNEYMVINLNGTYYHYCGMPDATWSKFKRADSFGSDYNAYIKGNYDCRQGYVPRY